MTDFPRDPHTAGKPLVSIITPAYQAGRHLSETIDSVRTQTFANLEHIIVDDGSRDRTPEIIAAAAAADGRVRSARTARNGGVAAARNGGLELAPGEPIFFLGAGDPWVPGKLDCQGALMQENDVDFSYMDYLRTGELGDRLGIVRPPNRVDLTGLLKSNVVGNLTAMVRRSAVGDARFLPIGHEDYAFWLLVIRRAGVAHRVPTDEPLCLYRTSSYSLSANKLRAAAWQWRIYRDVARLGIMHSSWLFSNYLVRGLSKRTPYLNK